MLLTLLSLPVAGQSTIAELHARGSSLEDLIPKGWKLLDSTTGDLNKDGISDLVFVVQGTDARNLELSEGPGMNTVDLNPRILGIYFGSSSGKFTKQVQSN